MVKKNDENKKSIYLFKLNLSDPLQYLQETPRSYGPLVKTCGLTHLMLLLLSGLPAFLFYLHSEEHSPVASTIPSSITTISSSSLAR